MDAIAVKDLRKSFGDLEAVKGISFSVPEGTFFAFLGPNGAGKSTTISIICSLLKADSGEASVFGHDVSDPAMRSDMGVVFQDPMMDGRLTVRENIRIRGSMYGIPEEGLECAVDDALATADATEFADRMYGKLSGGQRRRADIARALVHKPKLLLLDEPTSGLDPQTRSRIWSTVRELNRSKGMTVLLTTHYMEEASGADDIVIIDRGSIVAHGTPSMLRDRFCKDRMTFEPTDMEKATAILDGMGAGYKVEHGVVTVDLASTSDAVPMVKALDSLILSFEVRSGTLDDAFIAITGGDRE